MNASAFLGLPSSVPASPPCSSFGGDPSSSCCRGEGAGCGNPFLFCLEGAGAGKEPGEISGVLGDCPGPFLSLLQSWVQQGNGNLTQVVDFQGKCLLW